MCRRPICVIIMYARCAQKVDGTVKGLVSVYLRTVCSGRVSALRGATQELFARK